MVEEQWRNARAARDPSVSHYATATSPSLRDREDLFIHFVPSKFFFQNSVLAQNR